MAEIAPHPIRTIGALVLNELPALLWRPLLCGFLNHQGHVLSNEKSVLKIEAFQDAFVDPLVAFQQVSKPWVWFDHLAVEKEIAILQLDMETRHHTHPIQDGLMRAGVA
jgi:hypothetical protein